VVWFLVGKFWARSLAAYNLTRRAMFTCTCNIPMWCFVFQLDVNATTRYVFLSRLLAFWLWLKTLKVLAPV
jgi:hypothetical protein